MSFTAKADAQMWLSEESAAGMKYGEGVALLTAANSLLEECKKKVYRIVRGR